MTNDQSWESPGSRPGGPDQTGFGGYGPPAGPYGTGASFPAPGSAAPGSPLPPPEPSQGWRPPPKPGLIPLRPLTLGELLGASFKTLRSNPRPVLGTALLIVGTVNLVTVLLTTLPTTTILRVAESPALEDADALLAGAVGAAMLGGLVSTLLTLVAYAFLQGLIVVEVARGSLGEKLAFRALWSRVKDRLPALLAWTFLLTLFGVIALAAFVLVVTVVMVVVLAIVGDAGALLGVLFLLLALAGVGVVAAWLTTMVSFVPSAIVLERASIRTALRRSWRLVRGSFWRILGVQLLVWLILAIAMQIIQTPFALISLIGVVIDPSGGANAETTMLVVILVQGVVGAIISSVAAVVQCAVVALLYLDQRMRREGLDLTLSAHVESGREAGEELFDAPPTPGGYASSPPIDSPWA